MRVPLPPWPMRGLKLLLLAPCVYFAVIGVVLSLRRERPVPPPAAITPKPADQKNPAPRLGARPRYSDLSALIGPPAPFSTEPSARVLAQRYAGSEVSVDSAGMLLIGNGSRAYYREDLHPYRRILGGARLEFVPVRVVRKGAFESVRIYGIRDTLAYSLFTLTLNRDTRRVIQRNVELRGEGVFLHSASPSNRYFVLDHGCCPGTREFEVFDADGNPRVRGSYLGPMRWEGESLHYLKVVREKGPGGPGNPCPGRLDELFKIRKAAFREGREDLSATAEYCCLEPGGSETARFPASGKPD